MNSYFTQIISLPTVDSTNTYLKCHDYPDKTLVYTYHQKNGRGRNLKKWIDFKNQNLALSVLIRPKPHMKSPIWYVAAFSLSLVKLLKKYKIKNAWIKWPNDIFISHNKLAGILAEMVWQTQNESKLIIGIGININVSLEQINLIDQKATSLMIQINKTVDLQRFTRQFIRRLDSQLKKIETEKTLLKLKKEWFKQSRIIGQTVEWIENQNTIRGMVTDINPDGALLLKTGQKIIKVYSGEIRIQSSHDE